MLSTNSLKNATRKWSIHSKTSTRNFPNRKRFSKADHDKLVSKL